MSRKPPYETLSMLAEALVNQVASDAASSNPGGGGGGGGGGVSPGVALSEAAAAYRRAAGILEKAYGEDHEATETARVNEQAARLKMQSLKAW